MRNNRFSSLRILMFGLSVFVAGLLIACTPQQSDSNSSPAIDTVQPFEISVTEVKVISKQKQVFKDEKLIQTDQHENRLIISVLISNDTDLELKEVWFELQLNSEVEPYIASHILKFTSDKMDITTREKALAVDSKEEPIIWGFSHEWDMLLTSEEDLASYYDLLPADLTDGLKSITVQVNWSGGTQAKTIPIELSKKDVILLK